MIQILKVLVSRSNSIPCENLICDLSSWQNVDAIVFKESPEWLDNMLINPDIRPGEPWL